MREACEIHYVVVGGRQPAAAVAALAELELPVGTVAEMKHEAVPDPAALLP
ncbi:MAG: hypothetical protein U0974_00215 [Gemmatimonadales bacterium]|nr:hypothetical protein [Gemmatimonadales bacterium]MDZ4388143.1 hypothetical protein [Gemmatimonadales bacterium]